MQIVSGNVTVWIVYSENKTIIWKYFEKTIDKLYLIEYNKVNNKQDIKCTLQNKEDTPMGQ